MNKYVDLLTQWNEIQHTLPKITCLMKQLLALSDRNQYLTTEYTLESIDSNFRFTVTYDPIH